MTSPSLFDPAPASETAIVPHESPSPNLVIVGVYKSGTTSLFDYLCEHPDVCGTSLKQVAGWEDGEPPWERYRMYLAHERGERYRLEAAPTYFTRPDVARGIKRHFRAPKIVAVLREPASRLYSNYKYERSLFNVDGGRSFMDFVEASAQIPEGERDASGGLDEGYYCKHLGPWFDAFGDDVKVLFFEHLQTDPRGVLQTLSDWLSLDPSVYSDYDFQVKNRSIRPRNIQLHKAARTVIHAVDRLSFLQPVLYERARRFVQTKYRTLNTRPDTSSLDASTRRHLESLYRPHNIDLRRLLEARGYSDFPSWLDSGALGDA